MGGLMLFSLSLIVGLLLSEFRFGWDMSIQAIVSESSKKSAFQTFMVVMVKGKMGVVQTIKSLLDQSAEYCNMKQVLSILLIVVWIINDLVQLRIFFHFVTCMFYLLSVGAAGKCGDSSSWKREYHQGVIFFWCWCAPLIARSSARSYWRSESDCPRTKEAVHSRWTWNFAVLLQGCFIGRQEANRNICISLWSFYCA